MELNIYAVNRTGANKAFCGYNFDTREEALNFMFGLQFGLKKTHKTVALIAFCCGNLFHTIDVGQRFPFAIHQSEADFLAQLPKKDL
jgi:hypothetical protein